MTEGNQIDLARESAFWLGHLEIRPSTREVLADSVREPLEPRVMQVLVALARRRGEVVSRDELIDCCWSGRAVGDDAINRCIGRVRRLSETHGGFSLETIPRIGYRLLQTEPDAAAPDAAAPDAPQSYRIATARMRGIAAVALLLVLGAVFGLASWMLAPDAVSPASRDKVLVVRPPARLTIAVLPFTPLYADPEAQHLGDSIAYSVADMLASSVFDVIAPAKSFQFRGAAKAGAAQALHADFLIDGDIRREAGTITVALRVIDGHSGTTVIAGSVERPAAYTDGIPEEVATTMSGLGTIRRGPDPTGAWDARVMAAYFRAAYQYGARSDLYGANETAREAARIAPNDAFAQALHGFMAAYLVPALPLDRRPAMITEARDAANRAIRLDPGYGDSYAVLALLTPSAEWAERERLLDKGLTVFPDALTAGIQQVELLHNVGRFGESVPKAEKLYARNPGQTRALIQMINTRLWTGNTAKAEELLARGRRRFPDTAWFAAKTFEARAFHGAPEAVAALLRDPAAAMVLDPVGDRGTFATIAAALRYRRAADVRAMAADCARPEGRTSEVTRTCFMALVVLGRLDDAFRLATILYPDQRAASAAARQQRWLATEMSPTAYLSIPVTAPLRADPRFRDVAERVGLLQYWKAARRPPDFCATERAPVCRLLGT